MYYGYGADHPAVSYTHLDVYKRQVYVRDRTQENRDEYVLACVRSERCLRSLPFDYERIGEERYARTWNVKNGYEGYCTARDQLLEMDSGSEDFIPVSYTHLDVYKRQGT